MGQLLSPSTNHNPASGKTWLAAARNSGPSSILLCKCSSPDHLANVDLNQFYRGINRVEPSLVRVEADEATYNMHIMLRLEIEMGLIEGSMEVKDLPEIWNAKMQDYLGITPPSDAEGVLQDVHWSSGLVGYFPTYALGNLASVQLWDKMLEENPNIPDEIAKGKFDTILGWMHDHMFTNTVRSTNPRNSWSRPRAVRSHPEPYVKYLKTKYSEIYDL